MRPADHAPDFRGLETPVALVDGAMMAANIARMQAHIDALGVAFRPHVKTTKCVKVARLQRRAGARGITVSTLREADQFFEAGFTDVLYAVGITPNKMAHVLALRERGCALKVIVDSVEAAHALVAAGRAAQHAFDALIEIDTDGQRAGVTPDSDLLLQIGRTLHDGGMHLAGVMTHAGGSYGLHTPAALAAFAEQERSRCVHAAGRLRAAGLPCPTVSVGSTPTALSATHLEGVTEVRAGVYVFNDLVMAGIGVCGVHDIALSVLGTVIGHQPEKGWTLIDAGWMALSRDRGTQGQPVDQGYGLVCAEDGTPMPDYIVSAANQEHGTVTRRDGSIDTDVRQRFPLGSRLRVLPNHACATAAQFSQYHVLQADDRIETWPRFGGW
jgi:D-serine deaminase-like pyridoxal phosphate-dependent protein